MHGYPFEKTENKYLLPFTQWPHFRKSLPYTLQQQKSADLDLEQLSLKKAPQHHDPFMHKIWDRGEQKRGEERILTEMQQECHQNPQNVFSNWLVHMSCFIILINRLQSQSSSLTEEQVFFLKANQFKKSTTTKEETYKAMLSQQISNMQNCETFRNFKVWWF